MIRLRAGVPLIEIERSGVVESLHTGHLVVLDAAGEIRFSAGTPEQPIFARSSLKPFQAVGMLRSGLRLAPPELALGTASHSGSTLHRELIAAELAAAGLTESDLDCPPALPIGPAELRSYLRDGLEESRLAMNCSGKHTAMLLACLANDWPVSGYLDPAHPLQRLLADTVADLAGEPVQTTGIDGCGAPLFAISLAGLARGFARIATAAAGPTPGPERQVAEAMRAHPELVAGEGRAATTLMRTFPGLIAKDGAEGVFAAALPDGGAVAVKIDDGASRAADLAVVMGLRHLGLAGPEVTDLTTLPVLGGERPVGRIGPATSR